MTHYREKSKVHHAVFGYGRVVQSATSGELILAYGEGPYAEYLVLSSDEAAKHVIRAPLCWACNAPMTERTHVECPGCGRLKCTCGACRSPGWQDADKSSETYGLYIKDTAKCDLQGAADRMGRERYLAKRHAYLISHHLEPDSELSSISHVAKGSNPSHQEVSQKGSKQEKASMPQVSSTIKRYHLCFQADAEFWIDAPFELAAIDRAKEFLQLLNQQLKRGTNIPGITFRIDTEAEPDYVVEGESITLPIERIPPSERKHSSTEETRLSAYSTVAYETASMNYHDYSSDDFDVSMYEHSRDDEGMPEHDDYGDRDDWY